MLRLFFFFNDTAPTEIYTLSLHDALPIRPGPYPLKLTADRVAERKFVEANEGRVAEWREVAGDRKSTRLNSSHPSISYAVFCLKKKKKKTTRVHGKALTSPNSSMVARRLF